MKLNPIIFIFNIVVVLQGLYLMFSEGFYVGSIWIFLPILLQSVIQFISLRCMDLHELLIGKEAKETARERMILFGPDHAPKAWSVIGYIAGLLVLAVYLLVAVRFFLVDFTELAEYSEGAEVIGLMFGI